MTMVYNPTMETIHETSNYRHNSILQRVMDVSHKSGIKSTRDSACELWNYLPDVLEDLPRLILDGC